LPASWLSIYDEVPLVAPAGGGGEVWRCWRRSPRRHSAGRMPGQVTGAAGAGPRRRAG